MCLVTAGWWSYWSKYAGLTKEDVLHVPERLALGLDKTVGYLDQAPADEPIVAVGANGEDAAATSGGAMTISKDTDGGAASDADGSSGNRQAHRGSNSTENVGKMGKETAVPSMLARRPHEIDNSVLQVRSTTVARTTTTVPARYLCVHWKCGHFKDVCCLGVVVNLVGFSIELCNIPVFGMAR